jgi:hypothetical protein
MGWNWDEPELSEERKERGRRRILFLIACALAGLVIGRVWQRFGW